MSRLFLIDALNFIFRSYYAIGPITSPTGESTGGLYGFIRSLMKIMKEEKPDLLAVVFDGPDNKLSRTSLYEHYKSHRTGMPEDLFPQLEKAVKFCQIAKIPMLMLPGVEADDAIGSVALWAADAGHEVVICSSDKDLCQLVRPKISMLNAHKQNLRVNREMVKELFGVFPEQMVDYLALVGDASDNIPGVEGFGPKTAATLLQEMGTLDEILAHPEKVPGEKKRLALIEQKQTALLSRQLATIQTDLDIPQEESFYRVGQPERSELEQFYLGQGFLSLVKELESSQPKQTASSIEENYMLVNSSEALEQLLKRLEQAGEIAIDCETTALHPLGARLVGIGFAIQAGEAWYLPWNGELEPATLLKRLTPLFERSDKRWIGHNIKFDAHALLNEGLPLLPRLFDTMIASYLISPHQPRHGLDHLALEIFQKAKIPITDLIGKGKQQCSMAEVPIDRVCHYCCEDVDYTLRLRHHFGPQLEQLELISLFEEMEMPLIPVLMGMERTGMYVDTGLLAELKQKLEKRLANLAEKIYQIAGEPFNINSPKQLSQILFEKMGIRPPKKTATGYSTSADVLESLRDQTPIVEEILVYRVLEKLRSTYLEALPQQVYPPTGRIHCTFSQSTAATGRLACQDPNLQNIPVRSEEGRQIRSAFRPQEKGLLFLSADYSQIELRILAHLSEDPYLLRAFQEGEDIHTFTASLVFHLPLKEVTPAMRHQAKAVNFGILYGQQAYGLSQEIGISHTEAARFIEAYFKQYARVKEFLEFCKESARKTGRAITMTGRQRPIPEIQSKNPTLRALAERLAINTPLQGSQADLIKMAMLAVDAKLKEKPLAIMVLQIHDELLFEVPESNLENANSLILNEMKNVVTLKVPLLVESSFGQNWGEC